MNDYISDNKQTVLPDPVGISKIQWPSY